MNNNFKRIKECKTEHEMADLVCGYISNNLHKMYDKESCEFNSLPFLRWLQSENNIFDEENVTWGDIRTDFKLHYPELNELVDDYRPYAQYQIQLWIKTGEHLIYDYRTKETINL